MKPDELPELDEEDDDEEEEDEEEEDAPPDDDDEEDPPEPLPPDEAMPELPLLELVVPASAEPPLELLLPPALSPPLHAHRPRPAAKPMVHIAPATWCVLMPCLQNLYAPQPGLARATYLSPSRSAIGHAPPQRPWASAPPFGAPV